jgi:hypothetical protein
MSLQDYRALTEGNIYLLNRAKSKFQIVEYVHNLCEIRNRLVSYRSKNHVALLDQIDEVLESYYEDSPAKYDAVVEVYSENTCASVYMPLFLFVFFAWFYTYSMVIWFHK